MDMDVRDKVVWITGTSRGIGRVLARSFASMGAIVVGTQLEEDPAFTAELKKLSPGSAVLRQDVRRREDATAVAEQIAATHGRLDVLINNAGVDPRVPADEMKDEQWEDVLATNLHGSWYGCRAAIPLMKQRGYGKIINVGSITAIIGMAHLAHYVSSKAGLVGLTRGLARDLGKFGIRVNCLVLGAVAVEKEAQQGLGSREAALARVNALQAISGRIEMGDVVPFFTFFSCPLSDPMTGQCLTVDKGWTHT